jgi:beta-phosphoglucomutase-like phosphatase (HAD superfamily)
MKLPVTIDPRYHDAVIFDLDGVLTDTACSDAAACPCWNRRWCWRENFRASTSQRRPAHRAVTVSKC